MNMYMKDIYLSDVNEINRDIQIYIYMYVYKINKNRMSQRFHFVRTKN